MRWSGAGARGAGSPRSSACVRVLSTNALVENDRTLTADTERRGTTSFTARPWRRPVACPRPRGQECRYLTVEGPGGGGGAGRTSTHRLRATGPPHPARAVHRRARRAGRLVRAARGDGAAPRGREDPSRCARPPAVHHQTVGGSPRSAARARRPRRDLAPRAAVRSVSACSTRGAGASATVIKRSNRPSRASTRSSRNPDTTRTRSPRLRGRPSTTPEAVVARTVLRRRRTSATRPPGPGTLGLGFAQPNPGKAHPWPTSSQNPVST